MSWIDETLQPNGTLINKLGVTDQDELREMERLIVLAKFQTIPDYQIETINDLRKIHFWLFSDIYDWAGKFRPGDFHKGNTVFFPRDRFQFAIDDLNRQITKINQTHYSNNSIFASDVARLLLDINNFHPFREGNGRSQRLMIQLLSVQKGFEVHIDRGTVNYEKYMDASISDNHSKMTAVIMNELEK